MSKNQRGSEHSSSLARFSRTAEAVSENVIGAYSTSFGIATQLLGKRHRNHIRNIYALVRVADEIVDGVAREAGLSADEQFEVLERYENDTHQAIRTGYSTDLVIHAFAQTARASRIDRTLTEPFFASMRADLASESPSESHADGRIVFDRRAHADYVHGSAEVVGLMCLRVFTRDSVLTETEREQLERGAQQLGAAFQNINFLRDLGDDIDRLGRSYLGCDGALTDADLRFWVGEIRSQLSEAEASIPLLPSDARAAVRSALSLFSHLTDRLARTPVEELYSSRVRVPDPVKAALASSAVLATLMEGKR
ncbi:phytoene/squalene synthase family protein [Leucobacter denitrificans]|uniref:Squalene/phytoene synthase family protein n=1 Tax=Leucobacter denitrificans TaxID=683042 RepID=A0A7G9S3W3_9MICO|nr:squalene/phytoene synthase family protein [Leucobacter denitrificans]QNN62538.1 squalene/phytoene synthase family protein [Leucobacter denitrificans]